GVAAGDDRPLARHAVDIDRRQRHIRRDRPGGADLLDALAPLAPADRPRPGRQQLANGIDLALGHPPTPRCAARLGRQPYAIETISSSSTPVGVCRLTVSFTFAFISARATGDSQLTFRFEKSASSTPTRVTVCSLPSSRA